MTRMILIVFLCNMVACGVKGPPEPPLPTEASLKKEQLKKEQLKEKKKQTTTESQSTEPQNQ